MLPSRFYFTEILLSNKIFEAYLKALNKKKTSLKEVEPDTRHSGKDGKKISVEEDLRVWSS